MQLAGLAIITHVLQLRHNGLYTINKHPPPTHTHRTFAVYFPLTCLPVEQVQTIMPALLDLQSLQTILSKTLFGAESLPALFYFLIVSLQPLQPLPQPLYLCCAASLHPPLSSLNISIWLCQLHFHLHFIYPLHPRPSPVLIIYAKVMAGAASPLSNQKFMRHCGGSQVLLEVYFILVLYGRHVEHRRYCICVADRKQYPAWIFHNLL